MWVKELKTTEPSQHYSLKIGLVGKAFSSLVDHHSVRATQLDDTGEVKLRLGLSWSARGIPNPRKSPRLLRMRWTAPPTSVASVNPSPVTEVGHCDIHPGRPSKDATNSGLDSYPPVANTTPQFARTGTGTYDDAADTPIFHHELLRRSACDDRDPPIQQRLEKLANQPEPLSGVCPVRAAFVPDPGPNSSSGDSRAPIDLLLRSYVHTADRRNTRTWCCHSPSSKPDIRSTSRLRSLPCSSARCNTKVVIR